MTAAKLLFISTRFLFPADSGGKIRTGQILRGMKNGRFSIVLASPAPEHWREAHGAAIDSVCDEFIAWPERRSSPLDAVRRGTQLLSRLPMPVATDRSREGSEAIAHAIERHRPDVVVVDFPHAAVLLPRGFDTPSVLFTHNVESEIFGRHASVAKNPLLRMIWKSQHRKMWRFEQRTLAEFDGVVAVSARDRDFFAKEYGLDNVFTIPTGVDLDFFAYESPPHGREVVFTGSMDWLANQDGIEYFMDDVWPLVTARVPDARMTVVGRSAPPALIERAAARKLAWSFTGFVDDVRAYIRRASVYVIPLRVGGGTRIKAYEAMASGCPVVSTTIGVEGLPLQPDTHYLLADDPAALAARVCELMENHDRAAALAESARAYMESKFSFVVAANAFERICVEAIARARGGAPAPERVSLTQ